MGELAHGERAGATEIRRMVVANQQDDTLELVTDFESGMSRLDGLFGSLKAAAKEGERAGKIIGGSLPRQQVELNTAVRHASRLEGTLKDYRETRQACVQMRRELTRQGIKSALREIDYPDL